MSIDRIVAKIRHSVSLTVQVEDTASTLDSKCHCSFKIMSSYSYQSGILPERLINKMLLLYMV